MVENVGGIVFTVDADTGELIASIRQVDKQSTVLEARLNRLTAAVRRVTNVMKTGATLIGAAAAAIGAVAKASASAARELGISARQAGVSVEEFQALAFAARSVGVEQDKLGDIFKDSQDKVGDFLATGGGELKDFFETIAPQIGLTAEEFRGLSGPQILGKFQQALDGANLSASEQIFFLESLADEASRLRPLLTNNNEALRQQTDRFNELNLALTQTEIEALDELSAKFGVLGDTIRLKTAGAVAFFADEIGSLVTGATKGLAALSKAVAAFFGNFGDPAALTTVEQVRDRLRELSDERDRIQEGGVSVVQSLFGETDESRIAAINAQIDALLVRFRELQAAAAEPLVVDVTMGDETNKNLIAFNTAFEETVGNIGLTAQRASAQLGESMGTALTNVGNRLADVTAQAIVFGESFSQGAKAVAQALLTEVISSLIKVGARILINQGIAAAATGAITAAGSVAAGILASAWSGAAALVSLATLGANAAPAQAGIAATVATAQVAGALPGRQQGGPVAAGQAFRVNEGGAPEVFTEGNRQFLIPNAAGQVVSNAEAGQGGQPTQVNINVTNNAQARVDVGRVTQDNGSMTVDIIVADISSGNGPVSRALSENTNVTRRTR